MTTSFYNTMTTVIGATGLLVVATGLYSLVRMVSKWKTPDRKRYVLRMAFCVVGVCCLAGIQYSVLFFVYLPGIGQQQVAESNSARLKQQAETSILRVGDAAPNFSLTTSDGEHMEFPESGTVTLINFYASWCEPCQIELPFLERLWTENKGDEHFRLLVVGREESKEAVDEFREKRGSRFRWSPIQNAQCSQALPKRESPGPTSSRGKAISFTRRLDSKKGTLKS